MDNVKTEVVISGTGIYVPKDSISNQELCDSFNSYVDYYNKQNPNQEPLQYSSPEFIEKASGIKNRYVLDKEGILDITCMRPRNLDRSADKISLQAEMAVVAAKQAFERANVSSSDIDAVICAGSNFSRGYPAIAIEIQEQLGVNGFGFDMNVACASAAFALTNAYNMVANKVANTVLVVNPEICTAHLNFRDRDQHFIFGDAGSAVIVQNKDYAKSDNLFSILNVKLQTKFSNNIRNNFGFLNATTEGLFTAKDFLFKQEGRKVFKEVIPFVSELITKQIEMYGLKSTDISRLWLHQANSNMNSLIAKKVLNKDSDTSNMPLILNEFANTSSPGSIISFHKYNSDLKSGDFGVLSAFGAGYSAGSILLRKN